MSSEAIKVKKTQERNIKETTVHNKETTVHNNKETYRNFVKNIPLFSEFPEGNITTLLKNAHIKHYQKGKVLFFVEDKTEYFFIVVSGWVKLFRETRDGHESVLALLTEGDSFGKSAILEDTTYPYSAEVTDESVLLLIPSSFLRTMTQDNNKFDSLMTKLMKSRLHDMNQLGLQSEHRVLMTSAQRAGCFLLRLCRKQYESSITLQLHYEKSLVAARLGMTPETFSRSLNQLREIGVETNYSKVTIHNIRQLRVYVCDHCSATCEECPMALVDDF